MARLSLEIDCSRERAQEIVAQLQGSADSIEIRIGDVQMRAWPVRVAKSLSINGRYDVTAEFSALRHDELETRNAED